ncbi:hypothetical protein [Saccharopolyspora shandongensis]|uniref:hypothetical protein n=1 Tax=Saccharopolyspora shandongensis TaxID=418495 RepID=UPI0033D03520
MNKDELIKAVERVLGRLDPVYHTGANESDLYEAALLGISANAAVAAGGTCMLTENGRARSSHVRFRRSPGNLWNGSFTYGLVSFPDTSAQLEIHLGVYVVGVSGVPHECDVALLDHDEAQRSRSGAVHPRRTGLIGSVEAKHYAASPGIGIGRGFLGLASELGTKKCSLAFPAKSSGPLSTLIARKSSECFDEMIPGSPAAVRLRSHLDQAIRNWLAG